MTALWTLLLATSTIGQTLTGPGTPLHLRDRIEFFGDSITWQGGYLEVLSDHLQAGIGTKDMEISLIKRGINGGNSNDLRDGCENINGCKQAPFVEVLKQDRPRVAVIEIGINDVWHGAKGNPPNVYAKCLKDMVTSAKALGVSVVLATPSIIGEKSRGANPLDTKLDYYAEVVKKVGRESGSVVVDLRTAFFNALSSQYLGSKERPDRGTLTYDGVHMLRAGNRLLANEFERGIAKALVTSDQDRLGRTPHNPVDVSPSAALVPLPQLTKSSKGSLVFVHPLIVASTPNLLPLAQVLTEEIHAKTGVLLAIGSKASRGSIVLKAVAGEENEAYRIDVSDNATITASSVRGLTWGAVSLLQMIEVNAGHLQVPRVIVADHPSHPYRGLMIDVARRWHSIDVLKQCVVLCHLYKLNYLQLHLSDDQAFMFPSHAYPLINTQNQNGGPAYTVDELKALVRFADARGVTVVPEMDIPGHSATLNRTMPDLFKIKGTKPYEHHASINFVNEAVLTAIDTLIGEMCEVFHSSPYFHMGGDEADLALADQHPDFQAAFHDLGLPPKSQQELFRRFIGQVDEMVKRRGKKLIVWEGFGRDPNSKFPIPKDVLVMEFENAYYMPADLLEDGYSLVNASWTPLYVVNRHVWPARKVYEWDLGRFGRFSNLYATTGWMRTPDLRQITGSQACSWEGPEELEIENLRHLVPAMAERVWNPHSGDSYEQFDVRLNRTDALLDKLVHPVEIHSGPLDAVDPSGFDVPCFTRPLEVRLASSCRGTVRYTLDGTAPTAASPEYSTPFDLTRTTTVRSVVFNGSGKRLGFESSKAFYFVPLHQPNLATGKKVTVSGGTQGAQTPELVVDDSLDLASSWWAGPAPQWLQIDLAKTFKIDRIEVFPYWDGSRYYQYTVEVSVDGKTWIQVADRSTNTTPSSNQGDEIKFPVRSARYVRANMIRGSANDSVHLVEVRVWEVK